MQGIQDKPSANGADFLPVLAGVAFTVAWIGVVLALADIDSPLRAPFAVFFLFAGPACGLYAVLPGLDTTTRAAAAAAGTLGLDLAIAGVLSSLGLLTVGIGIATVTAVTAALFLVALGTRSHRGRSPRKKEIKRNRSGRSHK
ncbi:hypothetical protein ACWF94_36685 [Streptomyces sp. NPDC055078]